MTTKLSHPSAGERDSYDNVLPETINSLYKGECIHNVSMHPKGLAALPVLGCID